jgi:hypothetical protein
MTPTLLETIDRVHAAAADCAGRGVLNHRVKNPAFARLSFAISQFETYLKTTDTLENWAHQIGYLKLFRLKYATTILSAGELTQLNRFRGAPDALSGLLASSDSTVVTLFQAVDSAFKQLQTDSPNPLLLQLEQILKNREASSSRPPNAAKTTIAILCEWTDLAAPTKTLISKMGIFHNTRLLVVKPSYLKRPVFFDEIIVFGSWRWIERKGHSFVFRSPRSPSVVNFCFDSIPAYKPKFYELVGSPHQFIAASVSRPRASHTGFSGTNDDPCFDPYSNTEETDVFSSLDDMLPVIDLDKASKRIGGLLLDNSVETVEAKLVELSGNHAVWLCEDGLVYQMKLSSTAKEATCQKVNHVPAGSVEPGSVLIFSTAGGGDMIVEEANLILGDRAHALREAQIGWKQKLAEKMSVVGAEHLSQTLKASGIASASVNNLRNWASPTTIAPADRDHFIAVLNLCGLGFDVEQITTATDLIRRAHRIAGFRLSKKLLRMIQGQPLTDLAISGFQVFGGNETITSEKTAFTVESISAGTRRVDGSVVNKPFPLDEDLWR